MLSVAYQTPMSVPVPGNLLLLLEHLDTMSPVTAKQIKSWTDKDPVVAQVRRNMLHGWPSQEPKEELQQYWRRREELSVMDGCILWGARVVVPPPGREQVLQELHETHPGFAKMKSLARSYVWWPNISPDLEAKVRACSDCQASRPTPAYWHLYTYGNGHRDHGPGYILIMLVLFLEECF